MNKIIFGALLSMLLAAPYAAAAPIMTGKEENIFAIPWKDPKIIEKVEKLESCERPAEEEACHVDTNGLLSCGVLQYQWPTFVASMKQYNLLPGASESELMSSWKNAAIQRELAYKDLKNATSSLYKWKNCAIKKGLL